jgi:hypothetical protein
VDFERVAFEVGGLVMLEETFVEGSLADAGDTFAEAGDALPCPDVESLSIPVTEGYCLPFFLHRSF